MKRSFAVAAAVAVALAALAARAEAGCGDGWMGVNLVASPSVKAALRDTLAAHRGAGVALVPGRTYYGDYSGTKFAVTVFARPGSTRAVAILMRVHGRAWELRRITTGAVCTDTVPIDLIRAWSLGRRSGRCYAEPEA
jgi:hypothetical protein